MNANHLHQTMNSMVVFWYTLNGRKKNIYRILSNRNSLGGRAAPCPAARPQNVNPKVQGDLRKYTTESAGINNTGIRYRH